MIENTNIKIVPTGRFLCKLFEPLLNVGWLLAKTVFTPLAKSSLIALVLTAEASAAAIQKKMF